MHNDLICAKGQSIEGQSTPDHFADVGKMVEIGSGSQREITDVLECREYE